MTPEPAAPVAPAAAPVAPAETTIPDTPTPNPDNVYLKSQSAQASSFDASPEWAPKPDPMAPVDGDMETRWSSGYKDGEWISFDFGKPKTMSDIIIKWEQAYAPTFEILTSDDGTAWKRLVLEENQKGGTSEISFEPVTTRYVKLVGVSRANAEWGISIWEFEMYGPKDKNPDDQPKEAVFAAKKVLSENEKKVLSLKLEPGQVLPSPGPLTKDEFQRGVNYTSWGKEELADAMSDASLAYLADRNVGHIALMASRYQLDALGKVISPDPSKSVSDESLGHAINVMHALGMKVMLKPHIDCLDEDARSNIVPTEEWFQSFKETTVHFAELAAKYNVELFCIGTELANTTIDRWKPQWLDIIQAVRAVYKGPLTYAANWDEYETVSFWPEMDYIGIDAYFPLTEKKNPSKEELIAGWTKHADALEKWLKDSNLGKPLILTEVGYDTVEGSNKQPWRVLPTLTTYKESQDEQANCLEALLTVLSKRPWFKGFYWWNYFPRPDLGPLGYTLRGKKGEAILSEWFKKLK